MESHSLKQTNKAIETHLLKPGQMLFDKYLTDGYVCVCVRARTCACMHVCGVSGTLNTHNWIRKTVSLLTEVGENSMSVLSWLMLVTSIWKEVKSKKMTDTNTHWKRNPSAQDPSQYQESTLGRNLPCCLGIFEIAVRMISDKCSPPSLLLSHTHRIHENSCIAKHLIQCNHLPRLDSKRQF